MSAACPKFAAIVRKLHQWELDHLRELVAQQQVLIDAQILEIDQLTRDRDYAEDCARSWREDALEAIEDSGAAVGLTMDGHIVAVAVTPSAGLADVQPLSRPLEPNAASTPPSCPAASSSLAAAADGPTHPPTPPPALPASSRS